MYQLGKKEIWKNLDINWTSTNSIPKFYVAKRDKRDVKYSETYLLWGKMCMTIWFHTATNLYCLKCPMVVS